ncbi:MAG: hypothetical protein C4K60_20900 [Ideonella sp. MAG2]|nr:MAG: hypothetical protein C4K60_20900 [Ideonella sp. MAG2]
MAAPLARAQSPHDLLDPSVLLRKPSHPSAPTGAELPLAEVSLGHGLSMADSVAGSLDGLTAAAAARVNESARLNRLIDEAQAKLRRAIEVMAETMADYRQGLFCSGCGKTKTEILKAGDTFPHPGQQILRPTLAQIAAKEREMQQPVDRAQSELKELVAKRDKNAAEREEALAKMEAGLALWNTSLAYERQAIEWRLRQSERAYNADRQTLDHTAAQVAGTTPEATRERDRIRQARATLEKRQRQSRDDIAAAQSRLAASAADQQRRIDSFLARDPLPRVFSGAANITPYFLPNASFNDLGGLFRMGDFNVARNGETLARVEAFIAAFRRLPAVPAAPVPPADGTTQQKVKDVLKELLACDPEDTECRKPGRHGGTGVRG